MVHQGAMRATRARFDAGSQHRRSLIGKVHVAKKELQLCDDDYRAMLQQVTGNLSAADCTDAELAALVEHMKGKGFKPKKTQAGRAAADHKSAGKARAMWISLYHLGAIANPSEQALEAFAQRQLKVAALQWANQALCYKLIEALKAIAERHGWRQSFDGVPHLDASGKVRALKFRLCGAIMEKLRQADMVPDHWTLDEAAYRLAGILREGGFMGWSVEDFDLVAKTLGAKLREPVRPVSILEFR